MSPIAVFNKTHSGAHNTAFHNTLHMYKGKQIEYSWMRQIGLLGLFWNFGEYAYRLDCCWKTDGYCIDSRRLFGDVYFYCLIGFSSENSYGDVANSSANDVYGYSYAIGYAIWNLKDCSKINHMLHINTYFYWFKEKSSSSISIQDRLLRVRLCERDRNAGGSGGFSVVSTCSARRKFPINMLIRLVNVSNSNSNWNLAVFFTKFIENRWASWWWMWRNLFGRFIFRCWICKRLMCRRCRTISCLLCLNVQWIFLIVILIWECIFRSRLLFFPKYWNRHETNKYLFCW